MNNIKLTFEETQDSTIMKHFALWRKCLETKLQLNRRSRDQIRNWYRSIGFTNIRVFSDGTVNANMDGRRLKGLYLESSIPK
jgi:hypothetical protein